MTTSTDGRRQFTIRLRIDDKADRYRGCPECFVRVFDTLTNRVEARYAFRLDDIGTGERLKPAENGDGFQFADFTASDDGELLAWVDHTSHLWICHLITGRVATASGRYYANCPTAFSPNGKRLAIRDRDGIIRFLDPHTGRLQNTANNPPTATRVAAISPDGKRVATGHACGEVGVACSMAAGGLAAVMGGTNEQIENAAEIGMEHNLGLTCDPVGGLVQVPCIERNTMGAIKAVNVARLAVLHGDGTHRISLDHVIETMRRTGADMQAAYKETSLGGLAVNRVEC